MLIFNFCFFSIYTLLCYHCLLCSMFFSMYFIGVSGLRVLPLLINGMNGMENRVSILGD